MVSLRRRRLLGLCCGVRSSFVASSPKLFNGENVTEDAMRGSNPFIVHPMPMEDVKLPVEVNARQGGVESSNASGSSQTKEQNNQPNFSGSNSSEEQNNQPTTGLSSFWKHLRDHGTRLSEESLKTCNLFSEQEVKRRKQHRRRRIINNQEQCVMRGVYFKNMKWQAAIKVDKKQIHLGTVSSPEEAAHLYDRAAFMCGREPNFELPEEEKQELRKLKWDEFLAMTRRAITSKKTRRRHRGGTPLTEGFSASDGVEPDTTTSEHLSLGLGSNSFPSNSLVN